MADLGLHTLDQKAIGMTALGPHTIDTKMCAATDGPRTRQPRAREHCAASPRGSGLAREAHNATGVPGAELAKLFKWLPKGWPRTSPMSTAALP